MRRSVAIIVAAACLAGCAANTKRPVDLQSTEIRAPESAVRSLALRMTGAGPNWESFRTEWVEALGYQAQDAGMAFESVEPTAKPAAGAGVLLDVRVIEYHYVSPVARFIAGIMTGNASFDTQIKFVDIATGAVLGQKHYSATSSAWDGILAPMSDRQARTVAGEIMRDLRSARSSAPPPTVASTTVVDKAEPQKGVDLFAAERLAKNQACHRDPHATLTAKGPGFEAYSVTCENGDAIALRCEFGNCRVLK